MKKYDIFDWMFVPLICLTKGNKHKIVRATAFIISYTILLPWMVFVMVGCLFVGFILLLYSSILGWWSEV